jgi:RHS repeat-associated protein
VVTSYSYDAASQLTLLETANSLGQVLSRFAYTYNNVGLRTSMTDYVKHAVGYTGGALDGGTADGGLHVYLYDALNRLVSALHPANQQAWNPDEHFSYDAVGNRQTDIYNPAVNGTPAYSYDSANRLIQDTHFWYAFDANGNQTRRIHKATVDALVAGGMSQADAMAEATTLYTYGVENQLVRIEFPYYPVPDPQTGEPMQQVGGYAEYRYDALGRRIEKKLVKPVAIGCEEDLVDCVEDGFATTITRWVYDNEDILLEYGVTFTLNPNYPWWGPPVNTQGVLVARYTHGMGIDEPLATWYPQLDVHTFCLADAMGSAVQLSDAATQVIGSKRHSPYGFPVLRTGSSVTSYDYTGREFDVESGLLSLRARYYSSRTGRFLQEDPLFGLQLYRYAANNPTNRWDPYGLWDIWRWAYTGDGNAPDDVYNAAIGAAGDYALDNGGVRGFYAQMSTDDLIAQGNVRVGVRGQWTIEEGREVYSFVDVTAPIVDFPDQLRVGLRARLFGWKEDCGFYGPSFASALIEADGARFGVSNRRISLGVGMKGASWGIIVDPARALGNFRDSLWIIGDWLKEK